MSSEIKIKLGQSIAIDGERVHLSSLYSMKLYSHSLNLPLASSRKSRISVTVVTLKKKNRRICYLLHSQQIQHQAHSLQLTNNRPVHLQETAENALLWREHLKMIQNDTLRNQSYNSIIPWNWGSETDQSR